MTPRLEELMVFVPSLIDHAVGVTTPPNEAGNGLASVIDTVMKFAVVSPEDPKNWLNALPVYV
jgi:hypothetical protein